MVSLESDSCENKNLREDTSLMKSSRVRFLTQEIQADQHSVSLARAIKIGRTYLGCCAVDVVIDKIPIPLKLRLVRDKLTLATTNDKHVLKLLPWFDNKPETVSNLEQG
jgi:hypothetical protein